jgi:hypothetical protein
LAYGEYAVKKRTVFEWHGRFKEGREDVKDDPKSGQQKTRRTDVNVNSQNYFKIYFFNTKCHGCILGEVPAYACQ